MRGFVFQIVLLLSFLSGALSGFSQELSPAKMNGKWGFVDQNKTWVIKAKYEEVREFKEGFAAAKSKGRWGFLNTSGKWSVKALYTEVGNYSEGLAAAAKYVEGSVLWGYIDYLGHVVIPFSFTKVGSFTKGESRVVLPGLLPRQAIHIDVTGKQVTPPFVIRKEVAPNVILIVSQKENKDSVFCYIDKLGNPLTDWYLNYFNYGKPQQKVSVPSKIENDQEPDDVLKSNSALRLYAYLDASGMPSSPWFEEIRPFNQGFAPAKKNHRYGFINAQMEEVVPFEYLEIRVLDENRYVAQTIREGFVMLKYDGTPIGKELHGYDLFNDERLLGYSQEDFLGEKVYKKALFTQEGVQKSGWYLDIYPKRNAYYKVLDDRLVYLPNGEVAKEKIYNYIIDSTGEVISDWRPCAIYQWNSDKGSKYRDSVWQFLHQPSTNYYIEETFYENVFYMEWGGDVSKGQFEFNGGDFHDGMALVAKINPMTKKPRNVKEVVFTEPDIKYGFIDWNGDLKIPYKYDYISGFSDGKAVFKQNGKFGAIDYNGKVVLQPKFDLLGNFGSGMAPYYADSLWGYVSVKGSTVLKPQFLEALPHRYGYAAVKNDKRWGLIDTQGNVVLDFIYRKPPIAISPRKVRVLKDGIGYEVIDL